jgi:hypothetical protein
MKKISHILATMLIFFFSHNLAIAETFDELIDNSKNHQFWVIVENYSNILDIEDHRQFAFNAMGKYNTCTNDKKNLELNAKKEINLHTHCRDQAAIERNKLRGTDNSTEAFLNNPKKAFESAIYYAGVLSWQIYGSDFWKWHLSWKENGIEILDLYPDDLKKVLLKRINKKIERNKIKIDELEEEKKQNSSKYNAEIESYKQKYVCLQSNMMYLVHEHYSAFCDTSFNSRKLKNHKYSYDDLINFEKQCDPDSSFSMKKVSDMSKVSEKDRKLLSHVFAIGGAAMMLGFAPEKLGCGVKGFGNSAENFKKKIKKLEKSSGGNYDKKISELLSYNEYLSFAKKDLNSDKVVGGHEISKNFMKP